MPRFAANLSMMFQEVAFLNRFDAAAQAGFQGVEFLFPYDFEPQEIASRLQSNGLTQALFNLPPGDWHQGERGLSGLPGREDDFKRSLEIALVYAQATGVKRLHIMAGLCPNEADRPRHLATYQANLAWAADHLAPFGINALIEPINTRDMPAFLLNYISDAVGIIEELNRPNLKLQFDIYHRQIMDGDVSMALEHYLPLTDHIQIASVPKRHEPNTGELNDDRIFALLDHLGYEGWVGCEYRPAGETLAGLSWFQRYKEG